MKTAPVRYLGTLTFLTLLAAIPGGFATAQPGTWTAATSGTTNTLGAVSFPNETEGWAAGAFGTLLHSTDGGNTWTGVNTGVSSTNGFNQVEFLDASTGFAGGTHSVIRTLDGGKTWGGVQYSPDSFNRYGMAIISSSQVWRVGGTSTCCSRAFFRTTFNADGSRSDYFATATTSQARAFLLDVSFVNADNGWAVGWGGQIVKISNASGSQPAFDNQTSPVSVTLNGIQMLDAANGFIAGDSGTFLKTTDGGTTWQSVATGTTANLRALYFKNASTGWVAGNGGTIRSTTDGGKTWKQESTPTTSDLRAINVGRSGWAVGDGGTILKSDFQQLLLSDNRVRATVSWRSQYTGQTGIAYGLPQKNEFGFFYFTDPNNPEVFVKVLDFGAASPYLVFFAGLTDYEYTVTFTVISTGKSVSFHKQPGSYAGGADNKSLPHDMYSPQPPLEFGYLEKSLDDSRQWRIETLDRTEMEKLASPEEAPVPLADAQSLALSQGRVSVVVEWRSQYNGQTGIAYALPQKDEFGFFYFTDPNNPEVFAKVLDFGADRPYLVFYAGLTDYEYSVTFTVLRTGQWLRAHKSPGSFDGGADNGVLMH
jgi:photosystem II stability/assembly factor-like uncharacterized protein